MVIKFAPYPHPDTSSCFRALVGQGLLIMEEALAHEG
jgi:hypothetical protein